MENRQNMEDEFPALFEMYGRAEPSPEPGPGPEPPDTAGLSKEEMWELIPEGESKEALREIKKIMAKHPIRIYRIPGGGLGYTAGRDWKRDNWELFKRFGGLLWGPALELIMDYYWPHLPFKEDLAL